MSNVEKLKKYLIGDNDDGYLLKEISNEKVIMLSGEWGSGKTHFWHLSDDSIKVKLDQIEKLNIYISLYGKSSLQEIENEVFTKAYYKSLGKDNIEKGAIEKLSSSFSSLSSFIDQFSDIKVTPIVDFVKNLNESSKQSTAKEFIKEGLIIAFDDFERKSTLVNLNDLFGFITNLALQYKATIVIILNDDVFEGKEREVFTNVKEKTVSKYLKFAPTCNELFELIIQYTKYAILRDDNEIEKTLKDTFDEVGIVNARILIQVLDNLSEWHSKQMYCSTFYIRYFVLVNINFILNHHVAQALSYEGGIPNKNSLLTYTLDEDVQIKFLTHSTIKSNIDFMLIASKMLEKAKYDVKIIENLKQEILLDEKRIGRIDQNPDNGEIILNFIDENKSLVKSLHFLISFGLYNYSQSHNQIEVDKLNVINDFIETGIL
ncbi:P-loop NTPase fold protein [Sulfuricurvum sp.]|uniref:P-loop NTPase fold protein n=1 Tax=Sulfuricurvum sp. TaxID=2025608 RepID=UPI003BB6FFBD